MSVAVNHSIAGPGYGAVPLAITGSQTMMGAALGASDDITINSKGNGMTIRIVPANGGIIVSIRNDNNYSSAGDLYVVGEDQDLGAELGKIITMHHLKKE